MEQGKIYWSLCHSVESENYLYNNAVPPRTPWKGKLQIADNGLMTLHSFNSVTGEIDHDSNAYAFVQKHQLYDTLEEAREAFFEEAVKYKNCVKQFLQDYEEFLIAYASKSDEESYFSPPQL